MSETHEGMSEETLKKKVVVIGGDIRDLPDDVKRLAASIISNSDTVPPEDKEAILGQLDDMSDEECARVTLEAQALINSAIEASLLSEDGGVDSTSEHVRRATRDQETAEYSFAVLLCQHLRLIELISDEHEPAAIWKRYKRLFDRYLDLDKFGNVSADTKDEEEANETGGGRVNEQEQPSSTSS